LKAAELGFFSESYEDARSLFTEHLQKLPSSHRFHWDPISIDSKTTRDLFFDVVYLPSQEQAENLLILSSGIHGPEAFLGSAIQSRFLANLKQRRPLQKTSLLIFHIVNPYGSKHFTRGTEHNVNLNRNFHLNDSDFLLQNSSYDLLKDILQPTQLAKYSKMQTYQLIWKMALLMMKGRVSKNDLIRAVGLGQFHETRGLEFGGSAPEFQTTVIAKKLSELVPQFKNVILFDIHTGLGKKQTLHILPGSHPKTLDRQLFEALMPPPHEKIYELTKTTKDGFYETHGDFNNFMVNFVDDNQRLLALTLEFGTRGTSMISQMEGLYALIFENQGRHYGHHDDHQIQKAIMEMRKSFYPTSRQWRYQALSKAERIIHQALLHLE
jgi:octopine/nopaline transport system ATP-binding protein